MMVLQTCLAKALCLSNVWKRISENRHKVNSLLHGWRFLEIKGPMPSVGQTANDSNAAGTLLLSVTFLQCHTTLNSDTASSCNFKATFVYNLHLTGVYFISLFTSLPS